MWLHLPQLRRVLLGKPLRSYQQNRVLHSGQNCILLAGNGLWAGRTEQEAQLDGMAERRFLARLSAADMVCVWLALCAHGRLVWDGTCGMVAARGTPYLQAVEKELHAIEIEEHLAVVRCLICDVPQSTPGELHDLVTLWGRHSSAMSS